MKRTTLAWLSVGVFLVIVALLGLTVLRHPFGQAWQMAQAASAERQDLKEGEQFPQALAAAKAQGLPTSAAELQRPLPPPEQNAAPIYVHLMQRLQAHPVTKAEETAMALHTGVTPPAAQWEQIASLLHGRKAELALVHEATARPDCVFTRDWAASNPADITFPELATVRDAAKLLRLESLLMAHQGKYEAAARNQALGFQIARHGESDGLMIPYLVGVAGDSISLDGLKRIMTMAGPNASLDDTTGTLITRDWKPRSTASVLHSEAGFNLGYIAYLRQAGPQGLDENSGVRSAHTTLAAQGIDVGRWNAMLDYNGFFLLDRLNRAALKADGPYTEAKPALTGIDAETTDKRHLARVLATLAMPLTSGAVDKRTLLQAMAEVDRAGAAVLAQSARTGHPPDHLPSGFSDPFTGKPLGYRREGPQGFVIYSVGKAGHFDGGKPGEYSWKPYQAAFRYPGAASQ